MKKLTIATLFLLAIAATESCKQCTQCVKYPGANDTQKLCRKDFATDDSYTQAFHYYTSLGYRCE
jgi:hypothetical protein